MVRNSYCESEYASTCLYFTNLYCFMPYIIVLVSRCKDMHLFLICNFRNEQGINIRGTLEIESGVPK